MLSTFTTTVTVLAAATAANASVMLNFDTEDDFLSPLTNGQEIDAAEFGNLLTISGVNGSRVAVFDTDPAGPNDGGPDQDLIVGLGNALIVQETAKLTQSTTGIFDEPNDNGQGGAILFSFNAPAAPQSVTLIDINGGAQTDVILTDSFGNARTYDVPARWTFDPQIQGNGFATLDLTTLLPQQGEPGATGGNATATEDAGFDPNAVTSITIEFSGSGAVDNLMFIPSPGAASLAGLAGIAALRRRR